MSASLGVEPSVLLGSLGPDVVEERDGQDDKDSLVLSSSESVEDGSVHGTGEGSSSEGGDGVSSDTCVSKLVWAVRLSDGHVMMP